MSKPISEQINISYNKTDGMEYIAGQPSGREIPINETITNPYQVLGLTPESNSRRN